MLRRIEMDNHLPAFLDDLITVHCQIETIKRASLVFTQEIVNQNNKTLCTAKVLVASIDHKLKRPIAIPKIIMGVLPRVS